MGGSRDGAWARWRRGVSFGERLASPAARRSSPRRSSSPPRRMERGRGENGYACGHEDWHEPGPELGRAQSAPRTASASSIVSQVTWAQMGGKQTAACVKAAASVQASGVPATEVQATVDSDWPMVGVAPSPHAHASPIVASLAPPSPTSASRHLEPPVLYHISHHLHQRGGHHGNGLLSGDHQRARGSQLGSSPVGHLEVRHPLSPQGTPAEPPRPQLARRGSPPLPGTSAWVPSPVAVAAAAAAAVGLEPSSESRLLSPTVSMQSSVPIDAVLCGSPGERGQSLDAMLAERRRRLESNEAGEEEEGEEEE